MFWSLLTMKNSGRKYSHYGYGSYNKEDDPYNFSTKKQLERLGELWNEKIEMEEELEIAKLDLESYQPCEVEIMREIKGLFTPRDAKIARVHSISKRIEQLNDKIIKWTNALE